MGFAPPAWASQPSRTASLQVFAEERQVESVPVDGKAWYTLGADRAQCDLALDDASCSPLHAALVHHEDGKLYLIDLQSVPSGACCCCSLSAPVAVLRAVTVTSGYPSRDSDHAVSLRHLERLSTENRLPGTSQPCSPRAAPSPSGHRP